MHDGYNTTPDEMSPTENKQINGVAPSLVNNGQEPQTSASGRPVRQSKRVREDDGDYGHYADFMGSDEEKPSSSSEDDEEADIGSRASGSKEDMAEYDPGFDGEAVEEDLLEEDDIDPEEAGPMEEGETVLRLGPPKKKSGATAPASTKPRKKKLSAGQKLLGQQPVDEDGKATGRRKIQIEYIQDKSRRHITFSKRKAGIMKKAFVSDHAVFSYF